MSDLGGLLVFFATLLLFFAADTIYSHIRRMKQ